MNKYEIFLFLYFKGFVFKVSLYRHINWIK